MTMQHPEAYPHKQLGATRQSRRRPALVPVLKEMMDKVDNPHDYENRKLIKDQFVQFMHSSTGAQYHETIFLYWFDNFYRHLLDDYPEFDNAVAGRVARRNAMRAAKEKTTAALSEQVTQAIEKKAQIILLDLVLANGKALRDCTGRECREMSGRMGGWLRKISDRVKPTQIVGKVLQEADVRKLFGKG